MTALSLRLCDLESNAFFHNCLFSSIVLHVSGEIHSDLQVFAYPIVSLAYSITAVLKSSMVKAVSSWRMLKRFLSGMLNCSLMSASFSLENVWSLVPCHSNQNILQPQGHPCHKQTVVTTYACISHYSHILKRTSPFAIDDMTNLALGSSVR